MRPCRAGPTRSCRASNAAGAELHGGSRAQGGDVLGSPSHRFVLADVVVRRRILRGIRPRLRAGGAVHLVDPPADGLGGGEGEVEGGGALGEGEAEEVHRFEVVRVADQELEDPALLALREDVVLAGHPFGEEGRELRVGDNEPGVDVVHAAARGVVLVHEGRLCGLC